MARLAVVTGAFSYIGSAVARQLSSRGYSVRTLTNRRAPAGSEIPATALCFEPRHLAESLRGVELLVNTYWIRLPHAGQTFATAVENSGRLIAAAEAAGVGRFVHVSVSRPDHGVNLGYYAGKLEVERTLRASSLSHAIVRPTLVVGPNDVLSNNIAWFLRRFPVFPMPSGGRYRLQPVTLSDTARIIAEVAASDEDCTVDAAGPDVVTFREYVEVLAAICGVQRWMPAVPSWFAWSAVRLIEPLVRDVILTREELLGLQQELLTSEAPALGSESPLAWLRENAREIGTTYANDLDRHFRRGRTEPILDPAAPPGQPDRRA